MKKNPVARLRCIVLFLAALVPATATWAAEPTAAPYGAERIAAALQPFVDGQTLAGAVALVADKDRTLSVDTVGFADIGAKRLMPADALFWIASQSKPITAAALMMLVDEGMVNLDDPVAKYLPEFQQIWWAVEQDPDHVLLKKPPQPITVRQGVEPHQRPAVQVGARGADARLAAAFGRGAQLCDDAARVRAGGAYATNMSIDPKLGLITVYMVQHAGFPGNGRESLAAFRQAAEQEFGEARGK